jgi:hypothetical protein
MMRVVNQINGRYGRDIGIKVSFAMVRLKHENMVRIRDFMIDTNA